MAADRLCCFILIWLLSWAWLFPAEAVPPKSTALPEINSFKIIGARIVEPKLIRDEMLTRRPSVWPWKKRPMYDPEDFKGDVERVKALYRRQGFYHAEVVPQVEKLPGNRVNLRLIITEGPWIKVSEVNLSMAASAGKIDLNHLLAESPLQPGQRFTEPGYADLKKLVLNYLLDHGYPQARVEGQVLVYTVDNIAKVIVQAWPGPLCRFGPVTITDDQETPEILIRRRLTFKPGERFSLAQIYDSQDKLYALDLFQSVIVTPEEVPPGQREIPITINLKEKKKRSLKLGVGYGTEDEIRGRGVLRFRNLFGGGRLLDLNAKYSRLETRFEGSFLNPQIFTSWIDLHLNTGSIRRYLPAFTDRAFYTRAQLDREFPWKIRGYIGHGLEFSRPFNISTETLERLTATEPGKLYRASMLVWGLSRDSTDDPANPQRGNILTLANEFAPDFFGSRLQFVRTSIETRQYQNLGWKNFVLAGRIKFGLIEPIQQTEEIPIYRRLFSGGSGSVRGYRLDYLGPRNIYGEPLGGNSLLEGSLEFRFPIYKDFRGVIFTDCGNVFLKLDDTDPGQLKYASGFGLRYQTPIGPLGLDFAWPLNPIDPERDNLQIIFTIGQAF